MNRETLRTWPRRRLQIRSVISVTLPVGWTWVAATALVPYFLIGHGSGSSTATMFGVARATWMSLHVWSSIAMGLLTAGHVVMNRRGVARSIRIAAGVPNPSSPVQERKPGYVWVGAAVLILVVTVGGFAFAAVDDTHRTGGVRGADDVVHVDHGEQLTGGGSHRGNGRR